MQWPTGQLEQHGRLLPGEKKPNLLLILPCLCQSNCYVTVPSSDGQEHFIVPSDTGSWPQATEHREYWKLSSDPSFPQTGHSGDTTIRGSLLAGL